MSGDTFRHARTGLQLLIAIVKVVPIPEPIKSIAVGIPHAVLQIITIVEEAGVVMEDIEDFFKQALPQILLTLWIWGGTVVRMLTDQNFCDSEKQLDNLFPSVLE
ncbi:hypothetical protein FRB95_001861 [Tulasnella sp. JGI-2019a]|nr:hypothetical protein FRB95_001861 [Tulasnella sp. JGI-2019a]